MKIGYRYSDDVLYADSSANISETVEAAVKSGANLSGADLSGAYLRWANLSGADLSEADLRGANLPSDVPVIPGIDGTILDRVEQPGNVLDMSRWHTCASTHCRAGWSVHIAGAAGYELEERYGSAVAGALIYAASGSYPVPDWYASDEEAMEDLRMRAGRAT